LGCKPIPNRFLLVPEQISPVRGRVKLRRQVRKSGPCLLITGYRLQHRRITAGLAARWPLLGYCPEDVLLGQHFSGSRGCI
jgi:hypothetical protein